MSSNSSKRSTSALPRCSSARTKSEKLCFKLGYLEGLRRASKLVVDRRRSKGWNVGSFPAVLSDGIDELIERIETEKLPKLVHCHNGDTWRHGTRPGDSHITLGASDTNHPEEPHYGNVGNTINPNTGGYDGF